MAAVTADRVVVELEARLSKYETDVARGEAKFDKAMAGIQKNAGATERFVSRAMGGIAGAIAGVSAIALARTFLSIADASKSMEAQIKLATATFGSMGRAQDDVRRIADETRTGITETTGLYSSFIRAAQELGKSQDEAAVATETFSKALKIGGANQAQAASATLQLQQALQSANVQWEELGPILEASSRVSRLLTDSLGVTRQQLKKMAEDGKLSGEMLFKALTDKKFTAGIEAEFDELPLTFEDSMTRVSNAAIATFGAFDRGGEFSTALANFFTDGADGFEDMEARAEHMGLSIRGSLEGLGDAFDPFEKAGEAVIDALGLKFGNFADNLRTELAAILGRADDLLNIGPSIANRFGANGKFDSRLKETFLKGAERSDIDRRMALIMAGDPLRDAPSRAGTGPRSTSSPVSDADRKKQAAAAKKAEREAERAAREALQREQEERQYQIDILRARSSLTDNVEAKAQFEREMLDIEKTQRLADLKAEVGLSKEQRKVRLEAIERLYGSGGGSGNDITVDGGGLLPRAVSRELGKRLEGAANMRAEAEYDIAREALESQDRLADTRSERERVQLQILDLEFEERRRLLERDRELATSDAERGAIQARIDALPGQKGDAKAGVQKDNRGSLARYINEDTSDRVEELVVQELDYVRDGISDAISKRLGIKDPFLSGLLDLFIQDQIMKPLAQALSSQSGGGIGGFLGTIGGFLGLSGARANGGPVSAGGTYLVGERGPELLKMGGSPGVVVPNHALKGGGAPTVVIQQTVQVDARNSVNPDGFERRILALSGQQVQQGVKVAIESTPAYLAKQRRFGG